MATEKMDPDLKERWAKALETNGQSENKVYRQAVNYLRVDKTHYCCLGVLADLIDQEAWTESYEEEAWRWNGLQGDLTVPSHPDRLHPSIPPGIDLEDQRGLTEMNDEVENMDDDDPVLPSRTNWPEIAAWIRLNL